MLVFSIISFAVFLSPRINDLSTLLCERSSPSGTSVAATALSLYKNMRPTCFYFWAGHRWRIHIIYDEKQVRSSSEKEGARGKSLTHTRFSSDHNNPIISGLLYIYEVIYTHNFPLRPVHLDFRVSPNITLDFRVLDVFTIFQLLSFWLHSSQTPCFVLGFLV